MLGLKNLTRSKAKLIAAHTGETESRVRSNLRYRKTKGEKPRG